MCFIKRFFNFIRFKVFNRKIKIDISEFRDLVYVTNFLEQHPRSTFDLSHTVSFLSEEKNNV